MIVDDRTEALLRRVRAYTHISDAYLRPDIAGLWADRLERIAGFILGCALGACCVATLLWLRT